MYFAASFVDHEFTVSCVSVCLLCLHDKDKTKLFGCIEMGKNEDRKKSAGRNNHTNV